MDGEQVVDVFVELFGMHLVQFVVRRTVVHFLQVKVVVERLTQPQSAILVAILVVKHEYLEFPLLDTGFVLEFGLSGHLTVIRC